MLRGDQMSWRDVAFQYDGSFQGFLCCVYESYVHKEFPITFSGDEEFCSLYEVRWVVTESQHAQRVYNSLLHRSKAAADVVRRGFLTCLPDKEVHLYAFIRKLYQEGAAFLRNYADPVYAPLAKALRHMNGELEKLRGFVRFSDYNGVLGAEIEPKNRVLPLLRRHFCDRYANEAFFIYDRTHQELLVYADRRSRILHIDSLQLTLPGDEEVAFRRLWKRFYETVAIKERYNPRCQNTFMPKRYRGTMTEFLPDDFEARKHTLSPTDKPGAFPVPCAPDEISAPATPPRSGQSAPESAP